MSNLDLNLLRVFDAILRERNVLRASEAIHLSPSAVSHALSRLRAFLNDDLFVRTAAGMEPTARALEMAPLVRDALVTIERAIGPRQFDPGSTERQFCIAATDYMTAVLLPQFLRATALAAPHASITLLPASRIDLTTQIDVGRVEIALGSFSNVPTRIHEQVLFEERDMMVTAPDHPLAGREIGLREFTSLPLLVVSTGGSEDGFLSERGLTRRAEMFDRAALVTAFESVGKWPEFRIVQPHFLAIPSLLAGTRTAAIVPASLARFFSQSGTVHAAELPWEPTVRALQMIWHERHTQDQGHAWLRTMLADAAMTVAAASAAWGDGRPGP
ncbi:LysR substrate-binding domain-containing protein [Paraburkholderia rhynchosiae]|uniref:LysR family transcriptional regulator n=1 Tax=Paraburkholderia rhynchosiae TaxID=487049 RepID=A0A2N7VSU6_9BURK|nr:LysR substrate-binding domain-containing protein [Paraburkholderia rhynchosiae]PMS20205.1 LysR family transcriptional regulator [Paraburkholderia rhynchosiae]CAB3744703.1 PCP degradation transcriptional activation protein [Paraburkholderia rhynchosiae]